MQIWEFSDNWEYRVIRGVTGLARALEKSGNHKVFRCFPGVEKGCIGNKWVNHSKYKVRSKAATGAL